MATFNTIPVNLLVPGQYIEFDPRASQQSLPSVPNRMLIIAPRLASGTLPALNATRVRNPSEGEQFFGRGSVGAAMIAAVKGVNPYTDCFAIGVADAGGSVAATGTITIAGPATEAGSLRVYVAGVVVAVTVSNADSANVIATAIAAAVNANSALPVSANAAANVVTLTSRNAGTVGNDVDVRMNYNTGDKTPSGVTVTIAAMANGATNPDMTQVTAALGESLYNTVITPFVDATSLTVLENFMLSRWSGTVMKEGVVFGCASGTYNTVDALVASRNSPFLVLLPTMKSPTPAYAIASVAAALDASQCDSTTNINRPRTTLAMLGVLPPKESDRYGFPERNILLRDGGATWIVDDGGMCRIERLVTSYKTSNGVSDTAYQNVERIRTLAYIRYSLRVRIALKFGRMMIADNGTPIAPGAPIVTPNVIRNEEIAWAFDLQAAGLIENLPQFKQDVIVERDSTDKGRVNSILPPDLTDPFFIFAGQIQFR